MATVAAMNEDAITLTGRLPGEQIVTARQLMSYGSVAACKTDWLERVEKQNADEEALVVKAENLRAKAGKPKRARGKKVQPEDEDDEEEQGGGVGGKRRKSCLAKNDKAVYTNELERERCIGKYCLCPKCPTGVHSGLVPR